MKVLEVATRYCKESDWKMLLALKLCILSFGIMIGSLISKSKRAAVITISGIVFVITYIPIMWKFYKLWESQK